jgi:hypothetical protein
MNNSINDYINSPLSVEVTDFLSLVVLFVGLVVIILWGRFLGSRF